MSPPEAIFHCHDKSYCFILCRHGSCTYVIHMRKAESEQDSARIGGENALVAHTKEMPLIAGK